MSITVELQVKNEFEFENDLVFFADYFISPLKNAGLFQPKFGSNMDKPKCWVKNVIEKCTVESES